MRLPRETAHIGERPVARVVSAALGVARAATDDRGAAVRRSPRYTRPMGRAARGTVALLPALLAACAGLSGLTGGTGAADGGGGDDAGADTSPDTTVPPENDAGSDASSEASPPADVQPPDDAPVSAFAYRRRLTIVNGGT